MNGPRLSVAAAVAHASMQGYYEPPVGRSMCAHRHAPRAAPGGVV